MQHETRQTQCNMRRGMQHTTNLTTGRLVTRLVLLGFKPGPLDCPRVHICGHRACAAAAEHTAVQCGASPGSARVPRGRSVRCSSTVTATCSRRRMRGSMARQTPSAQARARSCGRSLGPPLGAGAAAASAALLWRGKDEHWSTGRLVWLAYRVWQPALLRDCSSSSPVQSKEWQPWRSKCRGVGPWVASRGRAVFGSWVVCVATAERSEPCAVVAVMCEWSGS